ncbi:MAG: hypothetical protein IRZ26_00730 [Clostridia bacterium]|nr:hypothetical protein [Clostridia bacterium]
MPADVTKWPLWLQIILLFAVTLGFWAAGIRIARRFPPERYLFKQWYLNLAVLALGLWAIVVGVTYLLPPASRNWAAMFGPALAFGLAYGIVQTQLPRPQPRPRAASARRGRAGEGASSGPRPAGAGRSAWTGRPRKKRRPGRSR